MDQGMYACMYAFIMHVYKYGILGVARYQYPTTSQNRNTNKNEWDDAPTTNRIRISLHSAQNLVWTFKDLGKLHNTL